MLAAISYIKQTTNASPYLFVAFQMVAHECHSKQVLFSGATLHHHEPERHYLHLILDYLCH